MRQEPRGIALEDLAVLSEETIESLIGLERELFERRLPHVVIQKPLLIDISVFDENSDRVERVVGADSDELLILDNAAILDRQIAFGIEL